MAAPKIPTLPNAPAPYTPPKTPVVNPFEANIDMATLLSQAADMLKPQFDQARTAETDRLAVEKVALENDAIKRGWDRSIYTANRQQKADTDSSKNLALIDSQAATAASDMAKSDYDKEYARQYQGWSDGRDAAWQQYSANLDAAKTRYQNDYQKWQDSITNIWNTYNAQYGAYQDSRRGGGSVKQKTDPYADFLAQQRAAQAAKAKAEKEAAAKKRAAQIAANQKKQSEFRQSRWREDY